MINTLVTIKDAAVIQHTSKCLQLKVSHLRDDEKREVNISGKDSTEVMNIQHDIKEVLSLGLLFSARFKNSSVTLDFDTVILLDSYLKD